MDVRGLASDLSLLNGACEASSKDIADLNRYLDEGRCLIRSLNPSYYAVTKRIRLGAGNVHQVCECDKITEVIGQADSECGTVITDSKFPQNWGTCTKAADGFTKLTNIEIKSDYLRVSPAIPEGGEAFVLIKCLPTAANLASEEKSICDCEDAVALSAYASYKAILRDGDGDPTQLALANTHLKLFADISGLKYQAAKYEAERLENE